MKNFSPTTIKNLCGLSRSLELARIELDKAERIYNAEYFIIRLQAMPSTFTTSNAL